MGRLPSQSSGRVDAPDWLGEPSVTKIWKMLLANEVVTTFWIAVVEAIFSKLEMPTCYRLWVRIVLSGRF